MTTTAQIKFGTDGWRAVIAREFTFANVERVAQAYADFLGSQFPPLANQLVSVGQISKEEAETKLFRDVISKTQDGATRLVIVGYDRRFLSDRFARSAAEILA